MTDTLDQCVICLFWQGMNIECRCSCFLGHVSGTNPNTLIWAGNNVQLGRNDKVPTLFHVVTHTHDMYSVLSPEV